MALDREQIVRTALEQLDEVGLDGLTLRELATRLGVKAPALYWHFDSKAALLDEMATTMLRDLMATVPDDFAPSGSGWRAFLEGAARGLHGMMRGRRDGAKVFSGTYLTDDALIGRSDVPLGVLIDAGLDLRSATWAFHTVYCFVVGFTIEEQAVEPSPGKRDERFDPDRRAARTDSELAAAAGEHLFGAAQPRFDFGLDLLLDGLAARIHATERA
ncbi:TetR family transcriptional regulator [Nakamurella sp. YIM 132087]|uniref:TetR family transcriptional regulator n=1 Tax=Nakamurella alba TaxID=2665158 RepID=A0A7K1FHM8_9ACTN|nr:TetR/AcrR family transcriptional regulator C-terminal domain-containing protein [Nakamurella alba]MTD13580.1 TetR family transcriptional regulator [Nakamurella alba]